DEEEEEHGKAKFKRPLDFLREQKKKEKGKGSEEEETEEEDLSIELGDLKISTTNPNRSKQSVEKSGIVELSRREREELERQRRQRIYEVSQELRFTPVRSPCLYKLHAEGKTAEAKADLARLAEVRRRREEAARRRAENEGGK
ncbi:28 kda heat- and acid-stable phosphoprotein, partial [Cystoisospora suis]